MKYELYIGKHCHTITGPNGLAIHFIGHDLKESERVARLMFEVVQSETFLDPVAWQFYQDGEWHNGCDRIPNHRKNTEAAGFPVRNLYAVSAKKG